MERGDEVVVLLARLVVEQRFLLRRLPDRRVGDPGRPGAPRHHGDGQLQHVERGAGVAVGQASDQAERVVVGLGPERGQAALSVGERAAHDPEQIVLGEPVQDVDAAAREQCPVHLEGRVLGGRAHQHDRALLDVGQEGVLLRPVEAMDLVDEEDRAPAAAGPFDVGLGDHLADLLDPREDGREGDEPSAGDVGHE